jgi:hypothetical protein
MLSSELLEPALPVLLAQLCLEHVYKLPEEGKCVVIYVSLCLDCFHSLLPLLLSYQP